MFPLLQVQLTDVELVLLVTGCVVGGCLIYYAAHRLFGDDDGRVSSNLLPEFRDEIRDYSNVALLVPETAGVDALAAAVGVQTLIAELGGTATLVVDGELTSEDSRDFCTVFDVDYAERDSESGLTVFENADAAVLIGGSGKIPAQVGGVPIVSVVRHRPVTDDEIVTVTRAIDGTTSTTVTHLIREAAFVPDQYVATALLHGIRVETREFRRSTGEADYQAASYLHPYADLGRLDEMQEPGLSGETYDVIAEAIQTRDRWESFAIANAHDVPTVNAVEEAADALLRLDGVATAAVFGVYEETIVVSCRADDVRTNAQGILDTAFTNTEVLDGNADTAMARLSLGLFAETGEENAETLGDLIDASSRKALRRAFEDA